MIYKKRKTTDQEMKNKKADIKQEAEDSKKAENAEKGAKGKSQAEDLKVGKKKKSQKKSKPSKEDEYKQKAEELNDKYLRLYSEFDNYRRRTSKEKLELAKTASEELIVELLPVLDDFERAIQAADEVKDCEAVKEGMGLIFNKLSGIMTKKGLKAIDSNGQAFDTDFHEAISYIPSPSEDMKGKVMDTVEKGYQLNDKVIRYSKVVIGQ